MVEGDITPVRGAGLVVYPQVTRKTASLRGLLEWLRLQERSSGACSPRLKAGVSAPKVLMTDQPEISVRLDDRVRLISAALAATNFPDKSQERKPHGTHAHARATRKYLNDHKSHPAIVTLQSMLDRGDPLEFIFALGLVMTPLPELKIPNPPTAMPPGWNDQLRDFYEKANLAQWWKDENDAWQKSIKEANKMLSKISLKPFFKPFLGEIKESFVFIPNITYPTDQKIGLKIGGELIAIVHPDLAWGESPPWPFDERPDHIYGAVISQFGRIILSTQLKAQAERVDEVARENELPLPDHFKATYPTWAEQFTALFTSAATAMFLQEFVSDKEAQAYLLLERKARSLSILPGMISVMRRYVQELGNGRYQTLVDFLPVFPKQLRVAKRILTM
jgi:hypothetical protein